MEHKERKRDLQVPVGLCWTSVEVRRFERPSQVFVHCDERGPHGVGSGGRGFAPAGGLPQEW